MNNSKLQEDLKNTYTWGNKDYPQNMVMAFKLLNKFKNWQPHVVVQDVQATAFAQTGRNQGQNQSSSANDDWKKKAKCQHCRKKGHIHPECPKLKEDNANDDDDEQSSTPT